MCQAIYHEITQLTPDPLVTQYAVKTDGRTDRNPYNMILSFAAVLARLAWRLHDFATNRHE